MLLPTIFCLNCYKITSGLDQNNFLETTTVKPEVKQLKVDKDGPRLGIIPKEPISVLGELRMIRTQGKTTDKIQGFFQLSFSDGL